MYCVAEFRKLDCQISCVQHRCKDLEMLGKFYKKLSQRQKDVKNHVTKKDFTKYILPRKVCRLGLKHSGCVRVHLRRRGWERMHSKTLQHARALI